MEKINVVLFVPDEKFLQQTLETLNPAAVNLFAIVAENGEKDPLDLGAAKVPKVSFKAIHDILSELEDLLWLICGIADEPNDIYGAKKFLMTCGVPENKIVNFEVAVNMSGKYFANLRHVEKYGADFFATGNDYMRFGLNLYCLPSRVGAGVNLSGIHQDLRQSFLTAKYVFEHVAPGTVKFVLIGLTPYSLRYENANDFAACTHDLQYMLALDAPAQNDHDRLLQALISDNIKNFAANVTAEQADFNFDDEKEFFEANLSAKSLVRVERDMENLTKKFSPESVEKNFRILKDYIQLCVDNGAKPVGVIFPFAPAIRENYDKELLTIFRLMIRQLEETTAFSCVDMFDFNLGYDSFRDMAHLNMRGSAVSSVQLSMHLYNEKLLRFEHFLDMNYGYFDMLSYMMPKENYNDLMDRVFKLSVANLRGKNKIKVAFVTDNAAMWCGDKLYNYFARDARFETTVFLCLKRLQKTIKTVIDDFHHGVEQFKARGLNVVGISEMTAAVPTQDVIFYLRPYMGNFPDAFRIQNITAKTLLIYIHYGFDTSLYNSDDSPILHLHWKFFVHSDIMLKFYDEINRLGMPRGVYSGYPRLDTLFEDRDKLKFNWKTARRKSKKIIWAPHWSIDDGVKYATFQWNYKFMYEFAKAHPEISWIVKPHPKLLFEAVDLGIFPSIEAFEAYLQAWNDLPNAQVYTGAYYHAIFATSDGMIHDCGSFIGEYQYVNKPMIYLTRDTQEYSELGKGILSVSYLVDGQDLNGIAALMQKVFIDGKDPKRAEREKFFDKYLNYYKQNGMSASEFIYRHIRDELKG